VRSPHSLATWRGAPGAYGSHLASAAGCMVLALPAAPTAYPLIATAASNVAPAIHFVGLFIRIDMDSLLLFLRRKHHTRSRAAPSGHLAHAAGLAVPTEIEAHPTSSGTIFVFWNAAAGATSYNIYRSTTPGGEGTIPIGSTTSTSYTDTGLIDGPPTLYYYKVA